MNARKLVVPCAFVAVVGMFLSANDYFQQERNGADRTTMTEMNRLCRSTLAPFDRDSPVDGLSKQTMDNIERARRGYCSRRAGAKVFDALSLYHVFGSASRAGVCEVVEQTSSCLQYLHQRVSTRQQRLPSDFEARFDELFKTMRIGTN